MPIEPSQKNFQETVKLQQIASDPKNSVFVMASAGSGKTKILTDRVLRLLLDGVNPSKILCLTYTKVAAFEMQNRIYQELSQWSILGEEDLKIKLNKLSGFNVQNQQIIKARTLLNVILDEFEGIKINTIHSFCQSLMNRFPIESNIRPNFQIIDKRIEAELLIESKNKLLQEALHNKDLAQQISEISANLNEDSFLNLILQLINKRGDFELTKEKFFTLENLNDFIFKILGCNALNQDQIDQLIENPVQDPNFDKEFLQEMVNIANDSKAKTDQKSALAIIDYLKNPTKENFNQYVYSFLTLENEPRKIVFTKFVLDRYENAAIAIDKEQNRLIEILKKRDSFEIAYLTTTLLKVADRMLEIYLELKNKNGYLDYQDLISKSVKLLTNPENSSWIKYKLDNNIEHILVDESQDTNHLQWQIIKAISDDFFSNKDLNQSNKTIFVVGDEKQSIFSFQDAQPRIFSDIARYYQNQLNLAGDSIKNISLNNSFRSLSNILEIVDLTFKEPKYKKAISPVNLVNHNAIRNGKGLVEIWPIINVKKEEKATKDSFLWQLNFEPKETQDSKEILAKIIAKKIALWIKEKRILKSKNRPIQPQDIMILLKNRTNNLGNLIAKNLQKEGILVNGNDKIDLVKNIIVQDLLSLAKFLLLKEDDLNLAEILKSPICQLTEEELLELCLEKNSKNISLFLTLKNNKNEKYQNIAQFLLDIENYFHQNPLKIYQIFSYILDKKGSRQSIINHFGKYAQEIINHFLDLCLNFQKQEIASLENLISWLNNFELEIKIEDFSNISNEVKITTIHSSKGLEANIVIIADSFHNSQEKFGASNKGGKILWLKREDCKIPIWNNGKKTELIDAIKEQEEDLQKEEYLRLLYVAMTRAKDELYIVGYGKNSTEDCWYNIIKNSFKNYKSVKSDFNDLIDSDIDFLEEDQILKIDDNELDLDHKITQSQQDNQKEEAYDLSDSLNLKDLIGHNIKEKSANIIYPSKQGEISLKSKQEDKVNLGKIIHKILEIMLEKLFHNPQAKELIAQYLDLQHQYLKKEEKAEIERHILNVIDNPKLEFLFSKNSKAEVPIMAKIKGETVIGKIDRLIINEDEILIIDYKSDLFKEDEIEKILSKYQGQIQIYHQIIQEIYPDKKVKSAILSTNNGKIYFLDLD